MRDSDVLRTINSMTENLMNDDYDVSMNDDYDVVIDTLQNKYNILWKMTELNMNSGLGMGIMDDIRLEQMVKLRQAINMWKDRTSLQREWVGLTDEEIEQGCKESWVTEQAWQSAVWWAEARLKEKNT
jgi:hypothetical protein